MIVLTFTLMLISLLFAWFRYQRIAICFFTLILLITVGLFLFEIYSPKDGFSMPWIQT
jgi:hypothetical protein